MGEGGKLIDMRQLLFGQAGGERDWMALGTGHKGSKENKTTFQLHRIFSLGLENVLIIVVTMMIANICKMFMF